MAIDLTGRVAIVTGAGGGLGREHALALAGRGARVVVNDLGGAVDGSGGSLAAAERVAEEIRTAGGQAIASSASVTDFAQVEAMVEEATGRWGAVDILVANAGILRDRSFAKMALEDFRAVLEVHVMGSVHCAKAVWPGMRDRNYGRIVFTTSSSGLYGNFGQSNYGAAKMALVGLMNTLALEGARYGIKVNCLAPTAGTRMLEGLMPAEQLAALDPALVSPAVLALVAEAAPTRTVLCAGAGSFEIAQITLTRGLHLGGGDAVAERILDELGRLADPAGQLVPEDGAGQGSHELAKAGFVPARAG
ncbi:NAD(P)-dependent dehydrogenase, short-chain alcohol dehydrogenase family [Tistlia consotensis]|uniref:NAD(P)-dependent dehydrogenase, short-chain alcohol dehydrogenase family n=1 Tax=Tistlia consotensis USBA 355 TaxID=560819 RepID=A0A1Y6C850_9PROT|nr:SDR family NAD(P)-dependent oxidoreductase [Tistlia consotensis]SMF41480.1 NAD(P)-dependent dehydrogenase, short-chain alcohol dehydrogenase family [Tistlia consotensis USBA 355]SNR73716.1 NAD(P)-dependent dehydrogenase, short-chain alcohol dehydrogenase family [Tistlia consotensis]